MPDPIDLDALERSETFSVASSERQAGAESEVTPEMIEAGVRALIYCDESGLPYDKAVKDVYLAMEARKANNIMEDQRCSF